MKVPIEDRTPQDYFEDAIERFKKLEEANKPANLSDYAHIQTLLQIASFLKLDEIEVTVTALNKRHYNQKEYLHQYWTKINEWAGEAMLFAKHGIPRSDPDAAEKLRRAMTDDSPLPDKSEPSKTDDEILDVPDGTIIGAGEGVHVHKGEVIRGTNDTFYLRVDQSEPTININNLFQDFINHNITIWIQDNGLANRPDSDGS